MCCSCLLVTCKNSTLALSVLLSPSVWEWVGLARSQALDLACVECEWRDLARDLRCRASVSISFKTTISPSIFIVVLSLRDVFQCTQHCCWTIFLSCFFFFFLVIFGLVLFFYEIFLLNGISRKSTSIKCDTYTMVWPPEMVYTHLSIQMFDRCDFFINLFRFLLIRWIVIL